MRKIFERVRADVIAFDVALDTGASAPVTDYVSLADWRGCGFQVAAGPVAPQGSYTVTILQATAADGTDAKAVGAPVVVSSTPGGDFVASQFEVLAEELDSGFGFVALELDGADTINATVLALRHDGRYLPPG